MAQAYDKSLLNAAPVATKSQLQEGYNPDLLNAPLNNNNAGHTSNNTYAGEGAGYTPRRKKPFWRTPTGMIVIAAIVIIIIAAVVGGAVGGTRSKNKKGDNPLGQTSSAGSANPLSSAASVLSSDGASAQLVVQTLTAVITGVSNQNQPIATATLVATFPGVSGSSPDPTNNREHPTTFVTTVTQQGQNGAQGVTFTTSIPTQFPQPTIQGSGPSAAGLAAAVEGDRENVDGQRRRRRRRINW